MPPSNAWAHVERQGMMARRIDCGDSATSQRPWNHLGFLAYNLSAILSLCAALSLGLATEVQAQSATFSFGQTSISVNEPAPGGQNTATVNVQVALIADSSTVPIRIGGAPFDSAKVTVQVAGGTAIPGVDFEFSGATLDFSVATFVHGVGNSFTASQSLQIPIKNDNAVVATKTILLRLVNPAIFCETPPITDPPPPTDPPSLLGTRQSSSACSTGSVTVGADATVAILGLARQISLVSGNPQNGLPGAKLVPFVVKVTEANVGVSDATVTWTTSGGALSVPNPTTDSSGQAQATLTLPSSGQVTVTARCPSCTQPNSVTFTATVTPLGISVVSGDKQIGTINSTLKPFVVSVTANGAKVPNAPVTWQITPPGDGRLSPCAFSTDGNGQASCTLTLGPTPGAVTVTASTGGGGAPATFTVNDATQTVTAGLKQISVMGNVAITTAAVQNTNVGLRLAALRRGAAGISTGGLSLNIDGQSVSLDAVTGLIPSLGKGGGASADASRMFGGLGIFLNGQGSFGDQEGTDREAGFAFHTAGLTLGSDYRFTNNLVMGAAFGYLNTKTELDDAGGSLKTNGYSVSAYGSYYLSDQAYVDGIATYGWNNYDLKRSISFSDTSATAKGSPDGNQFAFSVAAGYNFNFGPLTIGPNGRVNYIRVHIDEFQERGADIFNLRVDSQEVESLATDFGGQVSYAISMPWGVLLPMVRAEWEHEFKGGSRLITGSLVADPLHTTFAVPTNNPDRNYFNLGAGITATLKRGASAFFYYETVLGRDNVTNHSFNAGVRFQFE